MNRWFHPEFETDLIAAACFYEAQRPSLGAEFLDEAESAVETIMSAPPPLARAHRRRPSLSAAALPVFGPLPRDSRYGAIPQHPSRSTTSGYRC